MHTASGDWFPAWETHCHWTGLLQNLCHCSCQSPLSSIILSKNGKGKAAEPPPYSLFMRRRFWRSYPLKPTRCLPSNRAELLLIYRIPSHTNPKRRDFFLKHAGQKSTKEEGAGEQKGPKRTEEGRLKASTHVWEHDVGCSSHLTPTKNRMEPISFKTAWFLTRLFSFPDRGFSMSLRNLPGRFDCIIKNRLN